MNKEEFLEWMIGVCEKRWKLGTSQVVRDCMIGTAKIIADAANEEGVEFIDRRADLDRQYNEEMEKSE